MSAGHFHFHAGGVSRSKGYSAVKVSAYTSGQKLTHKQQLVSHLELEVKGSDQSFTVAYDYRHQLRHNEISDELRHDLAKQGVELSENATVKKKKRGGFEIADGEQTYQFHRTNTVDTLPLEHRKKINKGTITDALREDLRGLDIHLSDEATVAKDNRRHWTITDGDKTYTLKEHEKKVTNPATGKRHTAERVIHVYADRQHNFKTREDVKETGIFVPESAKQWLRDIEAKGTKVSRRELETIWSTVEGLDTATDSKTSHRMHMSFSRGLTLEQNREAFHTFIKQFTDRGYIVQGNIHDKEASDGESNLHGHVLVSTRHIQPNGKFAKNKRDYWKDAEETRIPEWRKSWADTLNGALQQAGSDIRVDHRSYEERKLDIVAGEHMGADWYRQERGESTQTAQENTAIKEENRKRDKRIEEIAKRVRAPEYTTKDEATYYEQQAKQDNQVYEPDAKTRDTHVQRIAQAEKMDVRLQKRLERLKRSQVRALQELDANTTTTKGKWGAQTSTTKITNIRPIQLTEYGQKPANNQKLSYASLETRVRLFGSKTSKIQRPGMANASASERKAWEEKARYLDNMDTEKRERFEQAKAYHLNTVGKRVGGGISTQELKEQLHRFHTWTRDRVENFRSRVQERGKGSDKEPER